MSNTTSVLNNTTSATTLLDNHKIRSVFKTCGVDTIRVITEDTHLVTLFLKKPTYKLIDITPAFDIDDFSVYVNKGQGKKLTSLSLRDYLENIDKYVRMTFDPNTQVPREIQILVSAKETVCELICDNIVETKANHTRLRNRGQYSSSSW